VRVKASLLDPVYSASRAGESLFAWDWTEHAKSGPRFVLNWRSANARAVEVSRYGAGGASPPTAGNSRIVQVRDSQAGAIRARGDGTEMRTRESSKSGETETKLNTPGRESFSANTPAR
jgi:hypothetical protein